ncbi:MAG: hypothetical protein ABIA67_05920, partial [Candidatus Margulisiibacteriota bacterium]
MIKKIIKIKGVGRFESFASRSDDISFDENTIIFGYNTYGKSTLTAILRSLKENNANYVYGRKTLGHQGPQEIEIIDENNKKYVFSSNWANNNIEIFDNDFISKNVFYGDQIDREQQSGLYGILVGEDIRRLRERIDKAKNAQKELETTMRGIESNFAGKGIGSFDDFISSKNAEDIDRKIQENQKQIRQQENISDLKSLVSKTPLRSDFANFKRELSKTLDLSVEESINEHIDRNWKDVFADRNFLSQGLDLLKDDGKCVFCGQDLTSVRGFISNMRKVFGQEYKKI